MKTISLKIPESLDAELQAAAHRHRRAKSQIVRDALQQHLAPGQNKGRASALDLLQDLVGCVEGPADLSVNEKHLEDYGR